MALQDSCSTSMWVKFFTDSGIPHSVAANYAVTFFDNRMTRNMLLDLNKEILRDMDIQVMGDVIAILKHAKVVHAQMTREKVFQNEPSVASVSPVAQTRLTSASVLTAKISRGPQVIPSRTVGSAALKRKRIVAPQSESSAKKTVVRRVLPEHEGPYKISMPSGTTPKTRKLLAQLVSKESVFERLGVDPTDSTVTTTEQSKVERTPIRSAAGTGARRPAKPSIAMTTGSSVFQRLGPGKNGGSNTEEEEVVVTSSSTPAVRQAKKRVVLEPDQFSTLTSVRPILKYRLGPKVMVVNTTKAPAATSITAPSPSSSSGSIVRFAVPTSSVRTGSQGILAKRNSSMAKSIYSRLGNKTVLQNLKDAKKATPTMIRVKRMAAAAVTIGKGEHAVGKSSVFRRLGPPTLET